MPDRRLAFSQWAKLRPASGWQFVAGHFTRGDRADIVGYHPSNGSLWLGKNEGEQFAMRQWATVSPPGEWQFVAGAFADRGRTDIVGYHPSNGTLWLGENSGAGFIFREWGRVSPASDWQFVAGNFREPAAGSSDSGRTEVVGYHAGSGSLWLGENKGSRFSFERWAVVTPARGWAFVAGHFTAGPGMNLVGYHASNGTLWLGENSGSGFSFREWTTVSPPSGWRFVGGRFTGGGETDLFGYHQGDGSLLVGTNKDSRLAFKPWGNVAPAPGWQFVAGLFDDDSWLDVMGYHSRTGSLWVGKSSPRALEGYCWPLSGAPGDEISFMLAGLGEGTAILARHRSVSATIESLPAGRKAFRLASQAIPPEPWRSGCGWDPTFKLTIPGHWRSGIYSAQCSDGDGASYCITFIVKPRPERRARIVVLANVNTWLAYNGWGGKSKYDLAARVSHLRPNPLAAVDEAPHLTRGELWILGWLESAGYEADVVTDIDFHNQGCDPDQYRCLILSTHPEYWTMQMRDKLEAYLNGGGCLAYLGGNGIFEAGDYEADDTRMVFLGGIEGAPRHGRLFRCLSPAKAERSLLGVATDRCGPLGSAYEVIAPTHPLLAGTGLSKGQTFGGVGLNRRWKTWKGNGKASGWETDTCNGPGATGIPKPCGIADVPVPPSNLPAGLTLIASGQHDGIGPGADMVYYDHPGGGFVFSVGSITFGGSLVVDGKIQQVMKNVLAKAGLS